jgi:hypothetical protein
LSLFLFQNLCKRPVKARRRIVKSRNASMVYLAVLNPS